MEIMSFILQYWWVWIITAIVSLAIVIYDQIKRIGRLSEAKDIETAQKGVLKGLGILIFFYITFVVSALLIIINIVVMVLRAV